MDIHRCRFVDYTPHNITASAFSHASDKTQVAPRGLRLAVGRANGDIEIWNPRYNWRHELTLPGARGRAVEGLVWAHAAGELPRLFSIGGSTYVTEWDLSTGRPRANLNCNAGAIWCIDANVSGTRLAVGCDDGSVVVVDIAGGRGVMQYEFVCQRQDQRVLGLRWFGDRMLIGGCVDGKVRCWAVDAAGRGKIAAALKVDKSKTESTLVWAILPVPARNQFVTGDSTGSVKFWDAATFSLVQSYATHGADVLALAADAAGERVFSAGIDRKIHQFSFVAARAKNASQWVHNCSRLLHSNDVRTLALFESQAYDFLVSGGVERSLIVQSAEHFQAGRYKKILMDQQRSNVALCRASRLIAMFQDQTVKIWRLADGRHKLVARIALADDDNVTSLSIGEPDGAASVLAVATVNSVKVFSLADAGSKLKVTKVRDANFDSVVSGAKTVVVYRPNRLLVHTPEDELYTFAVAGSAIDLVDEVESVAQEGNQMRAGFEHFNAIRAVAVSPDSSQIAVSRFNHAVELLSLDGGAATTVATLANTVNLMAFSERNTLVVLTEENALLEFNIGTTDASLLTPWSQRNSQLVAYAFPKLEARPAGIFVQDHKVWVYGSSWMAFFDIGVDWDVDRKLLTKSKKRTNDGLSISEADEFGKTAAADALDRDLAVAVAKRLEDDEGLEKKPFWMTQKYRPLLKVAPWADGEVVVIEREAFALPTASAFEAPSFKI